MASIDFSEYQNMLVPVICAGIAFFVYIWTNNRADVPIDTTPLSDYDSLKSKKSKKDKKKKEKKQKVIEVSVEAEEESEPEPEPAPVSKKSKKKKSAAEKAEAAAKVEKSVAKASKKKDKKAAQVADTDEWTTVTAVGVKAEKVKEVTSQAIEANEPKKSKKKAPKIQKAQASDFLSNLPAEIAAEIAKQNGPSPTAAKVQPATDDWNTVAEDKSRRPKKEKKVDMSCVEESTKVRVQVEEKPKVYVSFNIWEGADDNGKRIESTGIIDNSW